MAETTHLTGKELERLARNVSPGEWLVETERPIATLLGSCVAVCLYDPQLQIGGLNHFMLPTFERSNNRDFDTLLCGSFAMEALFNGLLGRGARKARLQAKAFGGGTIIASLANTGIGERNVQFAREWLDREGIRLVASDVLGPWSRKIVFDPRTGDVFSRRLSNNAEANRIAREEELYQQTLGKSQRKGNVELF